MSKLDKKINLYGLTMIAVGACIGSGIFASPGQIVAAVPNHTLALIVWGIGGLIALTGALTFSELGGMFPGAGGVYVYLKEAYGDWMGFLYGWVTLLVINTGALAALGLTFTEYLTYFIPLTEVGKIGVAIVAIIGLTLMNITGVSTSQMMAKIFTGGKLLALFGIIVAGFFFFDSTKVDFELGFDHLPDNAVSGSLFALVGVLWSFGGWHHASYLASETIDAKRIVPRAMVYGVLIVTVVYVWTNMAYMMMLPLEAISSTDKVAGDAISTIIPWGGKLMAFVIAISVFGTIAIYTMSAPRIYFAMAEDGIFFKQLRYIHPKYKTPVFAMLVQAIWAIVLLLFWGTFRSLITFVTFMDILFMTLAGVSIFVFRIKRPHLERPIKAFAYPIVPFVFVIISALFVGNTLWHEISAASQNGWGPAIAGLGLLAIGVPVYFWFKRDHLNNGDLN